MHHACQASEIVEEVRLQGLAQAAPFVGIIGYAESGADASLAGKFDPVAAQACTAVVKDPTRKASLLLPAEEEQAPEAADV